MLTKIISSRFSQLISLRLQEPKAAIITLTNPKKRNVLSTQAINQLSQALSQVQKNVEEKKTKILILQSEGTVFSSGHDLKEIKGLEDHKEFFDNCARLMLKIRNFPIPTLCVVNGVVAAAGFQMALACDMIIASEKSSFSTPGVKWGVFCSTPAVQLIRSISSEKKAMEMLMFGEPISAQEALQYGLVNKVVQEDKLAEETEGYIKKANSLSGEVIKLGKQIVRNQKQKGVEEAYCIAGEGMSRNIKQKEDCQEGLSAFAEKRHPHYKN